MKIYQLVNPQDGTRSEVFSCSSFALLAQEIRTQADTRPEVLEWFVLVLLEDADSKPFVSRAPLMRASSVVATFMENANHE